MVRPGEHARLGHCGRHRRPDCLGWDEDRVRAALDELARLSLLRPSWENPDVLLAVSPDLGTPARRDDQGLTDQERELLRFLRQGHTDEAVARKLGVSTRSARRVTADLMARLGARSRFQAGARAAELGWLRHNPARRDQTRPAPPSPHG